MALSPIEDRYLSALTAAQFPDMPVAETQQPVADATQFDGMQLAAAPTQVVSDAGGGRGSYAGFDPRMDAANKGQRDEMRAYDPTTRERIASFLQAGFEGLGMDRYKARQNAQTLIGGPSSNLPLDIGIADLLAGVSRVGLAATTPLYVEEGSRAIGRGVEAAKRGEYGTAALETGAGLLDVVPGVVGGVNVGRKLVEATKNLPVGMSTQAIGGMDGVLTPQLAIERVPGVKPGEELIVQHNLTAANLVKADKLGGLPVPSLAISKVGHPLEGFGEITLIAPKEMATPSAKNPVFASDAYTKRFPTIDYSIDTKSQKTLVGLLSDVAEKMPNGNYEIERLLNNWNDRKYSDVLKAKFLDERGELPNKADFAESWKFNSEVNDIISKRNSEYQDWLAKFDESLPDNGVNVKERIFKGYTYSGNRRYAEVNLTNLVKEMKGGANEEGWNYGVSSLRAAATPKFKKFSEIKAARDRVIDSKEMESVKEESRKAYESLLDRLFKVNPQYDAGDALLEVVQTRNINSLDREYDVPTELKADISLFIQKLKTLPTEYFEMKPQRAVSIDEFKGAIIPAQTPQAARDVLRKAGITEVYEYSTPEERKGLFQKYGKEMFAVMPAVPAGTATMQDKEQQ